MTPYTTSFAVNRFVAILLMLAVLLGGLSACGSVPGAGTTGSTDATQISTLPQATASSVPSAGTTGGADATQVPTPPEATATAARPTTAPSVAPQPTHPVHPVIALPRALVYNLGGQLYRIERDGITTTKLTNEPSVPPNTLAIIDFDVSPADGSLAYLVSDSRTTPTLVRTDADGTNRTVLLVDSFAMGPRFSPDGTQIAFGVVPDAAALQAGLAGGIYLIRSAGGTPERVRAGGPFDPASSGITPRLYAPSRWSPDSRKLLVQAVLPGTEVCQTAVADVESGAVITVTPPDGTEVSCVGGGWSAHSKHVYLPLYEPLTPGGLVAVAQLDATSGVLTTCIANILDSTQSRAKGLLPVLHDAFVGFIAQIAAPSSREPIPPPWRYQLHLIGSDGRLTAQRSDSLFIWDGPFWAPDASGAVVVSGDAASEQILMWVPTNHEDPMVPLVTGEIVGEMRWGR